MTNAGDCRRRLPRGTDVFKALALGAPQSLSGRPYVWGLASFGQPGVERVIDMIRHRTRAGDEAVRRTLDPGDWTAFGDDARSAALILGGLRGRWQRMPIGCFDMSEVWIARRLRPQAVTIHQM